jgi:hypothetical protein
LIHNGFDGDPEILPMFASMTEGWLKLIEKLQQLVNTAKDGTKPA